MKAESGGHRAKSKTVRLRATRCNPMVIKTYNQLKKIASSRVPGTRNDGKKD